VLLLLQLPVLGYYRETVSNHSSLAELIAIFARKKTVRVNSTMKFKLRRIIAWFCMRALLHLSIQLKTYQSIRMHSYTV